MTNKQERYDFAKVIAAKQACETAQVVFLDYEGGHRIAQGEHLLREIANGRGGQPVTVARIAVRDLAEAHAIEAMLARIAA